MRLREFDRSLRAPTNTVMRSSISSMKNFYEELRAWLDYHRDDRPLTFWRTQDKKEVDFIVGDEIAIEVKAAELPQYRHLKGLIAIADEATFKHRILVCQAPKPRLSEGIEILPVKVFLEALWADTLIE